MAFRTQRDKVVRSIPACFSVFDMVDMQLIVLGLPLAALALMAVSEQHVFPHVAETELYSLLVVGTMRQRKSLFLGLHQLGIELCSLHRYLIDRQELAYS